MSKPKDKNKNGIPDYIEEAFFWYIVLDMIKAILLIGGIYIATKALRLH